MRPGFFAGAVPPAFVLPENAGIQIWPQQHARSLGPGFCFTVIPANAGIQTIDNIPFIRNISSMPLSPAIERQRKPLLRIVATLFAMIGLVEGATVERLAPTVYRKVLRLLRPAESAVRRLIVVAARGLTLKPSRPRAKPAEAATPRKGQRSRTTFKLFDPRQRFASAFRFEQPRHRITRLAPRPAPRIRIYDTSFDPRVPLFRKPPPVPEPPPPPIPDGTVNAARLCRRLAAIKSALDDLPRQARRYARWQSKPYSERRPQLASALRPGKPPGHRKNPIHKVDEILAECDWLARHAPLADTS
jgi:hypothetical protein